MDGGFVDLKDIQTLEERGIEVYAPPKETEKPVESKNGWVQGWRERIRLRRRQPPPNGLMPRCVSTAFRNSGYEEWPKSRR